jgi:hypothetical protein
MIIASPRWKLGCALAIVLCMLLMSCVMARSVIQRRAVTPPEINLALGSVRLFAYVTNRPNCPPYGGHKPPVAAICGSDSIFSSAQAYTIWLSLPGGTSPSGIPRITFRRLVLLPIE